MLKLLSRIVYHLYWICCIGCILSLFISIDFFFRIYEFYTHASAINGTREIVNSLCRTHRSNRTSLYKPQQSAPPDLPADQWTSRFLPLPPRTVLDQQCLLVFTILNDLHSLFESDKNTAYLQLTSKRCTSSSSITFSKTLMGFLSRS